MPLNGPSVTELGGSAELLSNRYRWRVCTWSDEVRNARRKEGTVSLLNALTLKREIRSFPKAQPKEISFPERSDGSPGDSPVIDKA